MLPNYLPASLRAARHILAHSPPLIPGKHIVSSFGQSVHQLIIASPHCKVERGCSTVSRLQLKIIKALLIGYQGRTDCLEYSVVIGDRQLHRHLVPLSLSVVLHEGSKNLTTVLLGAVFLDGLFYEHSQDQRVPYRLLSVSHSSQVLEQLNVPVLASQLQGLKVSAGEHLLIVVSFGHLEELQTLRVAHLQSELQQQVTGVGHGGEVSSVVVVFEVLQEEGVFSHDGPMSEHAEGLLWRAESTGVDAGKDTGVKVEEMAILAFKVNLADDLVSECLVSLHMTSELFTCVDRLIVVDFDQILQPVQGDTLQLEFFQLRGDQFDLIVPQKQESYSVQRRYHIYVVPLGIEQSQLFTLVQALVWKLFDPVLPHQQLFQ